jgi:NADH dehydrogenase
MPAVVRMKAEPNSGACITEGATLTLEIPVRGHIQVRVAEAGNRRITLLTVAGHPIAGAARFLVEPHGEGVRFEIQVYDRPASMFDELMLRTIGEWLQRGAWLGLAENVARAAGGASSTVASTTEDLDDHETQVVNEWASTLSAQLTRNSI